MDRHELLACLKQLALELQRIPTRDEFTARYQGRLHIYKIFGGFTPFLQAAGFPTGHERRKKTTRQEFFGVDVQEVIKAHVPRVVNSQTKDFEPVLCLGDTHFPFAHMPSIEKAYRFAEKHQPMHIIQLGDLQDQFSHSRFPTGHSYISPDQEMEFARKQSVEFWSELKKACPKAKCYQITGNHDLRALKKVLDCAPSLENLVKESLTKLYVFDGVQTVHDYREELIIQNIMFHHGYMKHGAQRDFVMQNIVSGHTHRGTVLYRALKDKIIWQLDAGYLGDCESKPMSYTAQKTTGWTLGIGYIDEYGPRFIPW